MKKEKKSELIKAAIPAIMVLSGMWNAAAGVDGNMKPTAADVAEFRSQQARQEQPAEAAFMQGEESEGHAYLTGATDCEAECQAECSSNCVSSCYWTCTGSCKTSCSGTCKGGCKVVCQDNCYGGCMGTCAGKNWA